MVFLGLVRDIDEPSAKKTVLNGRTQYGVDTTVTLLEVGTQYSLQLVQLVNVLDHRILVNVFKEQRPL